MTITAALACCLLASGPQASPAQAEGGPPPIPREFRAAWVATVENIDWPSRPGLSANAQKKEAIAILDRCAEANLNAVILQVRPAADALYESRLEPWSYYLTGAQGKAPSPAYDPLHFWIDEAHKRGLQLHAWFNPFRAKQKGAKYEDAPNHVSKARPERVRDYGGMLWMDPGDPTARAQTLQVVLDVVRRYDVDGIHLDDYFYPYPIADPNTKREIDFPDDASWRREHQGNDPKARADWRRENISRMVHDLYQGIKKTKPHVMFGISPFGIPRPGKPKGVVGFDQYAKLYADTETWLRQGWCDYWTPQLYWKVDAPGQPYRPLLEYWISQNNQKRHVWPGLSISRIGKGDTGYAPEEIFRQIEIMRETPGSDGVVFFSMKILGENRRGLATSLADGLFKETAIVPASPWLGAQTPATPKLKAGKAGQLSVEPGAKEAPGWWVVQTRKADAWTTQIIPGAAKLIELGPDADEAAVTRMSRTGVTSLPAVLTLKEAAAAP